jgi:hypothetical protein
MNNIHFFLNEFKKKKIILFVLIFCVLVIVVIVLSHKKPMIYLYAWERSENFLFLKNFDNVGVAYFALQIDLYDDHFISYRRTTDLVIPKKIVSFPVIRVDMKSSSPKQYDTAIAMISDVCNKSMYHTCQIDFDITKSQEVFYKTFMKKLAPRIDEAVKVTATALPYRCYEGDFYHDVPIAYVVPLLINAGADDTYLTGQQKKQDVFLGEKCHTAIGVSTYESQYAPSYFKGKEVYLFSNTPWTEKLFKTMIARYSLH